MRRIGTIRDVFKNFRKNLTLCISFIAALSSVLGQVCLEPSISTSKGTICIEEKIDIDQSPSELSNYYWDFCIGELDSIPQANSSFQDASLNIPVGISIIEDQGNHFGFICSRSGNEIFVLDFGDDLENTPAVIKKINNADLNAPEWIELVKEGSNWVAYVLNFNDNNIVRLHFNNGFNDDPASENLGDLNSALTDARGLDLVEATSGNYLFISNTGSDQILRVEIQNGDWLGVPLVNEMDTLAQSSGISGPIGVSLIDSCSYWYGVVSSKGNDKYYLLDFGNDVGSDPVAMDLGVNPADPNDIHWVEDGGEYFAFSTGNAGQFYKLNFGNSPRNLDSFNDLGNFEGSLTSALGFDMVKDSSKWYGFSMSFTLEKLTRIDFPENCDASVAFSTDSIPLDVFYNSSGPKTIGFLGFDASGNRTSSLAQVTVTDDIAPTVGFTLDENQCIENENTFTTTTPGLIHSWDFDGDGLEDSNLEYPNYQFPIADTFLIRLEVTEGLCTNFSEQEIIMYNEPSSPSFTIGGTLCNNNLLTLTNTTDETGFPPEIIDYSWVFSGQDSIVAKNTDYTFSNSGNQTIRLYAGIPGCTVFKDSLVNLGEGSIADFSWINNCGDSIQMINESIGTDLLYQWNFGDTNTSTAQNPKHQYAIADTFDIKLQVTNSSACNTTITKSIIVNDQNLVSFSNGEAIENLSIQFIATDLTSIQDSIIAWNWNFADSGSSNLQNPNFIFSNVGDFDVLLNIVTAQGCQDTAASTISVEDAKCPTIFLNVDDSNLCLEEALSITNNSVNAINYEWDFCTGELVDTLFMVEEVISSDSEIPVDISIVYEKDAFYGFVTGRENDKIEVIDFQSFESAPARINVLSDDLLNGPEWIELKKEGLDWAGYILNFYDGKIIRARFENSLTAIPIFEDLGDLNGALTSPRGLEMTRDDSHNYLFITDQTNNFILRVEVEGSWFGNLNETQIDTIGASAGFDGTTGLSLIDSCGYWYGIVSSRLNNKYFHLNFGNDLSSTPTITDLGVPANAPAEVKWVVEAERYLAFGVGGNGDFYRLDFGNSPGSLDSIYILSDFIPSLDNTLGFEMVKDSTTWRAFSLNFSSGVVTQIEFLESCSSNKVVSSERQPQNVVFTSSGSKELALTAIGDNGRMVTSKILLNVSSDIAPDIALSVDDNHCLLNQNSFVSTNISGNISQYEWDFDSDMIVDDTTANPSHQFDSAAIYTVRLDVEAENGCHNFTEQEITIYNPPPDPDYALIDELCINDGATIVNNTNETGYDDALIYQWYIPELDSTFYGSSPQLSFSESGQKIIQATTQIPGCESDVVSDTIFIHPLPESNFSASNECIGEVTSFTNLSTPDASYEWLFGDGFQSSLEAPEHAYDEPGLYLATLTVTDGNGCSHTFEQEVSVASIPVPGFSNTLICQDDMITFQDTSSVSSGDITGWEWYVNDSLVSMDRNPSITFSASGDFTVEQVVTSSGGCQIGVSRTISVLSIPEPDFQISSGCVGDTFEFVNTTPSEQYNMSEWVMDDTSYPDDTLRITFDQPGEYEVGLTLTNVNLCTNSFSQTFTVYEPPALDFEVFDACENEFTMLVDSSTFSNDPIISKSWKLDTSIIGNGDKVIRSFQSSGSYDITLEVVAESGCIYETSKSIDILPAPTSPFTFTRDYGVVGSSIAFENSGDNDSVAWYLGDSIIGNENSLSYAFNEAGTFNVSMVSFNDLGCTDTSFLSLLIASPEIDIEISSFELEEDPGGFGTILLEVSNNSNLPVEELDFVIDLDNQIPLQEKVITRIEVGESNTITLNTGIPLISSVVTSVCVSVSANYAVEDHDPFNNERCLTLEPKIVFEPPYPNPAEDELTLKTILPEGSKIQISLISLSGKLELDRKFNDLENGLNTFILSLQNVEPGIYFLRVNANGKVKSSRIAVK